MTTYTRRDVLKRGAAVAAAGAAFPLVGRVGAAVGLTGPDPATALRNRLVVIFLSGGNDGLNTIAPMADVAGAPRRSVYDKVRPRIGYARSELRPLKHGDDAVQSLGMNPRLNTMHNLYRNGRLAVVQGVDYPNHNYSHFASTGIWESGQPETAPDSGWLGRHLDRAGIGEGEVRGLAIGATLPLTLRGRRDQGTSLQYVPPRFRDGSGTRQQARHNTIRRFAEIPESDGLRHRAGVNAANTAELVQSLTEEESSPRIRNSLANNLLTARVLLEGNYGCEVVFVRAGGYDNHAAQRGLHEARLADLDEAVRVFLNGDSGRGIRPLKKEVASRTLIMTCSEFGRRIGQNGSMGTDHGAAAPLFMIGPDGGRLVGGLHGDHPDMGTPTLPADNLTQTTDIRSVYQSVLTEWLSDPDPGLSAPVPGLFTPV